MNRFLSVLLFSLMGFASAGFADSLLNEPPAAGAASEKAKAAKKERKKAKNPNSGDNAKADARNKEANKPKPVQDPELAKFGIYAKDAPNPGKAQPVVTTLPLKLEKGDRIAFVGNTFFDRGQDFGWLESMIYQEHADLDLVMRNFSWSSDEVDLQPRPDNFATVSQHLTREKADVIFASFGYNESFGGTEKLEAFKERLAKWIETTKSSAFNGESGPRIVLVAPMANEDIVGVLAARDNNANIKLYAEAMKEVGVKLGVAVVDVFEATKAIFAEEGEMTINGAHLTESGYEKVDGLIFHELFGKSATAVRPELRSVVVDKNRQYFRRYRPLNTFYYTGGRNKTYGYLDFLPAMRNFEIMTDNREKAAWAIARGASAEVSDKNVPPLGGVVESRGANEWLSPEDELKAFRVDPRFEVNLFASEVEFPEIACPIQMRWDGQGRMWVACSTTYPHVYPGQEPNDRIVILEDTDGDGKADKSTVWADDVHIPLSFELTHDGIYVSEEPHLTLLRDTDGDGKADTRERVLTGFGTEDSHHALHDMVWTPDGDLLFRESIFHNTQVETPYGPVRAKNSAWFVFQPRHQKLISFGNYPNTNPWGVTFDDWGNHVASHPVFASAFQATNPPYPKQHPGADGMNAYSGVCGHEFVDFPNWPEEFHGGFVKVRYKPTNRVEYHKWVEKSDHMAEEYQFDIIFSENLSFIPVDLRYGPRGAMYVCDWYNPVKGHAQYSLRDPRRDKKSGRIWRIVPKGMKPQDPPKIAGASVAELLENLKRPEYRYRYWTKRELRAADAGEVATALDSWVAALDRSDPRFRHHQAEAVWTYRNIGVARPTLLKELLGCESRQARAAATRQLRYWQDVGALAERAKDANGIVRLEAAIAASYIGTKEALEAILPTMDLPMEAHLNYAIRTALGSEALLRHWKGGPYEKKIAEFVKGPRKIDAAKIAGMPKDSREANFDSQKGLQTVVVSCVPERIMYTNTKFSVKAGKPVKLVFTNPDATAHNLVIVQPGAEEEVGMAGNEMAKDPGGFAKGFVPESDKILWHTKLIGPGEADVLRFLAPEGAGTYSFVCTFPGHWVIMKGEMVVE